MKIGEMVLELGLRRSDGSFVCNLDQLPDPVTVIVI
jgi:hypothetical protein